MENIGIGKTFGKSKPLLGTIIIGLVLTASFFFYETGATARLRLILLDAAAKQVRLDKKTADNIAIVLIDETSLQALNPILGRWPWPRAAYSDLMEFFKMAPPKMVLYDILFTETQDPRTDGLLGANDNALVLTTLESGFGYHAIQILEDTEDEYNKTDLNRPLPDDFIKKFAVPLEGSSNWLDSTNNKYYLPFKELYNASAGIGVVEFSPDIDGVFRHTIPLRSYLGSAFPVLGLSPFINGQKVSIKKKAVTIGDREIPLDDEGKLLINVYGKFNTYSISGIFASYQKIMKGEFEDLIVDPLEFEDKIVYIGSSAVGVEDLKATSMSPNTPGVFLHAALSSNFILDDFLTPPNKSITRMLIVIFALICVPLLLYLPGYRNKYGFLIVLSFGFFLFCYQNFTQGKVYDFISPFSAIFFSSLFSFGYLLVTEGVERRRVKKMFSQYVSPEVLDAVAENYEKYGSLLSGGEEDITILFTDIRSFTSFSDSHSADTVVKMLNIYFSRMSEIIFKGKGTIDKFIGDAIMAFWGAPIKMENHPDMAVKTAINMIKELEKINEEIQSKGINHTIKIGFGINSGSAIVGNIGSERRLSYTVIGDAVNLAARLESITKNWGAEIIISEFTREKLDPKIPCRVIDRVEVRGKKDKIKIFQVFVEDDDESSRLVKITNEAYQLFENGDFQKALGLYESIDDGIIKEVFVEKCRKKLNLL